MTSSAVSLGPFPDDPLYAPAVELDATDPLASYRDRFVDVDPELIYLDGNSLGRLPVEASAVINDVTDRQWGDRLIRSWNEGWWNLQLEIGDLLAPAIGAQPGEVIISDSTSVNLHKLAAAALAARPGRTKIVTDDLNFPSDHYVLAEIARAAGPAHRLEIVPSDGVMGPVEALVAAIDDTTALVSLSHTVFKSGYTYDLAELTRIAHDAGALILWDMSHSVGSVHADLTGAGADLAVGCTYKYLNGGPGSPAFLFVRSDLQEQLASPISGWWAHAEPFAFDLEFEPVTGIRKFHAGTMPTLSLAAAQPGIALTVEAGMPAIRAKSISLMAFADRMFGAHLESRGFTWASPTDPDRRGSHVSLRHPDAWQITQALIADGKVLPDFRAPDNLRLGFGPLYTSHLDVHTSLMRLASVVDSDVWRSYPATADAVT
ncbi:MAG: kynureninase [Candidatus Poriferisodalaceae bacterium]|jgi:kynureninase